jgi:hypothetical protein
MNGLSTDYRRSTGYHFFLSTDIHLPTGYRRMIDGLQVFSSFLEIQCAPGDSVDGKRLSKIFTGCPKTLSKILMKNLPQMRFLAAAGWRFAPSLPTPFLGT